MLDRIRLLVRRYGMAVGEKFAEVAELAIIAGHQKKSVHTPGFCLAGGGWETLWQKSGRSNWESVPFQRCSPYVEGGHR